MSSIKCLIFDWFGVCAERWIDVWKRELPPEIDFETFKKSFVKYLDSSAKGDISGKEFLEHVLGELKIDSKKYEYLITKHGKINTDLLNMILKLRKKYKTALLTDNFEVMVGIIEKEIGGFSKYFDVVILSYIEKMVKIRDEMFNKVLKKLEEKPENCIFVDDRPRNIEVAKRLGLNTILYEDNEQFQKELSNFSVIIPKV